MILKDVHYGRISDFPKDTPYGKVFVELSLYKDILLKGGRIVIPPRLTEQVLLLGHQSHGLGTTKTIRYLRERVLWLGLGEDVKGYVADCYPCSVAISRNHPLLVVSRPLPEGPWKEVLVDFKGPEGGRNGFYYHFVIDNYFPLFQRFLLFWIQNFLRSSLFLRKYGVDGDTLRKLSMMEDRHTTPTAGKGTMRK